MKELGWSRVWFSNYKSENPLQFAVISTSIGIVFVLLEAAGVLGKLFDSISAFRRKCRGSGGGSIDEASTGSSNSSSVRGGGGGGESLSMELIEK